MAYDLGKTLLCHLYVWLVEWQGGCDMCIAGLVAVMLLLGFGLVRIPRSMLQEADPAARLAYAHHK